MNKKIRTQGNKNNLLDNLALVFDNHRYIYLSLLTSILFWMLVAILAQYSWLKFVILSSWFDIGTKISFFTSILFGNITNFSIISYIVYIVMALLVGINISVLVFSIKNYSKINKSTGLGFGAMILGTLGVGCATCTPFLLANILGTTMALSIVYFLPFKGLEINFLALVFLLLSIYLSVRQLGNNRICKTK